MNTKETMEELLSLLDGSLTVNDGRAEVKDAAKLRTNVHKLAEVAALESGLGKGIAQYLIRLTAQTLGIIPASIHALYIGRGSGKVPVNFSVPALNLRAMTFDSARAVFRVAQEIDAGAFIFEIARSEMGYTDQRPAEFASSVLAAAIAEGFSGPVFIQGDHFQVSAKRFASTPETELQAVKDLIIEAIKAGFFNIDVDTSTLVDLSKTTIPEQQTLNCDLSATLSAFIREQQPTGVTISVGGEIGEVGGHNSTEPELRAYVDGFNAALRQKAPGAIGLSKISIQTGTSHGGVVLPDGTIAKVSVDFDTLRNLSRVVRHDYGMGWTVQHGASTLPEDAFGKFVEYEACEVHLATNFMNILYDHLPAGLRAEMYAFLDVKDAAERKPGMTDEQFYYKTRKNALGPFKNQLWRMDEAHKTEISNAWEAQFRKLFHLFSQKGTRAYVERTIQPVVVPPQLKDYIGEAATEGEVSDLAD